MGLLLDDIVEVLVASVEAPVPSIRPVGCSELMGVYCGGKSCSVRHPPLRKAWWSITLSAVLEIALSVITNE